jgi:hypothetical protein
VFIGLKNCTTDWNGNQWIPTKLCKFTKIWYFCCKSLQKYGVKWCGLVEPNGCQKIVVSSIWLPK